MGDWLNWEQAMWKREIISHTHLPHWLSSMRSLHLIFPFAYQPSTHIHKVFPPLGLHNLQSWSSLSMWCSAQRHSSFSCWWFNSFFIRCNFLPIIWNSASTSTNHISFVFITSRWTWSYIFSMWAKPMAVSTCVYFYRRCKCLKVFGHTTKA